MGRMVKRLSNLEIDEVSLVDTPANQHGLVAIAKSYQEDNMAVFDANGDEVFEEELSNGDLVYDEAGTEYVFTEGSSGDDTNGYENDDVEKSTFGPLRRGDVIGRTARAVRSSRAVGGAEGAASEGRRRASDVTSRGTARARSAASDVNARARGAAGAARGRYNQIPASYRTGIRYGSAALGGAGAAEGVEHYRKSFGDEVLSDLSKALTDDDRDGVIAKAMNVVDEIAKRNEALEDAVEALMEQRELESYGQVAKSYGQLPVEQDELAGVLMRASQYLPDEDLAVLDRVFSGAGEVTKAYFDEVGVSSHGESSVLEQVYGYADGAISKGVDGLSTEQAVTAIFDTNPGAYDEYELEQRQR